MKTLREPLFKLQEVAELSERMKKEQGVLQLTGCIEAQSAHLIHACGYSFRQTVVVVENDLAAKTFYEDYRLYEPDAALYPAKDLLFYHADLAGNLLDRERIRVLQGLIDGTVRRVVLPAAALLDQISARESMEEGEVVFAVGDEADLTKTQETLASCGYLREDMVSAPGQFSSRGDILDVWSLTEEVPVRIEWFGDEIESIRTFDPDNQRSLEIRKKAALPAANDHAFSKQATLLDWFDPKKTGIFLVEPNRIADAMHATETELTEGIKSRIEAGSYHPDEVPKIVPASSVLARFNGFHTAALSTLSIRAEELAVKGQYSILVQAVNSYNNSFSYLVRDLKRYHKLGYRILLLSGSHTRAKRLAYDLEEEGLHAYYSEDEEHELSPGEIVVRYGHVSRGFEYPQIRFVIISETDIFGVRKRKRKKRNYNGERIASFSELSVGDYVVHENHGIGIYRGIEKIPVEGALKDYMKIEYDGSNLYVLATQFDVLQKYAGSDGAKVRLNKLGGEAWKNTKKRVRRAVDSIAKELVELYATRQMTDGYRFGKDTIWQKEFEELFPFEETEDQIQAIEDTKRDMESKKIMDRLICGDVGYGKTEVALRAAFKAVQESRQVAYLVPTTVLAQQHYNTFRQRLKDFPVRVDLLCRFRTAAEQKKTIHDLKRGQVDIVIGTHRLLSKDVQFKDLGLLVIDEEQRFGVSHKEKIKELRKNVDVLTLSATPIPRTLHMSLIGIRDMSTLTEAPQDRMPIQTYVMEYNAEMVREAICRELARNGQVYYVYNRVKDIADVARRLSDQIPEARIAYADGQMAERDLENVMVDFVNGEIDVLVTTTIIETGLDIPNVNTILIQDADRMGLAQLYQLRGRVGRSNRTAYAFLLYRKDKVIAEVAEKRLTAIREFTELGSGIKIAMRDLEIRGAGNLLGAEQHGHMEAIGYDLYCKLLSQAVKRVRGEQDEQEFETLVDLTMDSFLPSSYIPNEMQKLDLYKRIAGIEDMADYEDMTDELNDRFGPLPEPVQNLLRIAYLKACAHRASITEIKQIKNVTALQVLTEPSFDPAKIPGILAAWEGVFSFQQRRAVPRFLYHGDSLPDTMLTNLTAFVKALAE